MALTLLKIVIRISIFGKLEKLKVKIAFLGQKWINSLVKNAGGGKSKAFLKIII